MASLTFWRIDGAADTAVRDAETLVQGLERHLAGDDLLTLLVRINAEQQAYVSMRGCQGCYADTCAVGCRVALLRRVLREALGPTSTLCAAPLGLAPRPYTRAVLAWPTPAAQPLDNSLLASWPDARLTVHWRQRVVWHHLVGAALLFVGSDGPDPAAALRVRGWRVVAVTPRLIQSQMHLPSPLWGVIGRPWRAAPFLLLSAPSQPPDSRFAA